jgi:NUMOD4 motif
MKSANKTTYRDIPGYVGCYAINRDGEVLSLKRTIMRCNGRPQRIRPRILRQFHQRATGLTTVTLCRGGKLRTFCVHALVRETWGSPTKNGE